MTLTETGRSPGILARFDGLFAAIPYALVALVARVGIAGTFWKSGQTKVQGFAIDIFEGRFELGLPRFSDSAVDLFRDEYKLPVLPPELAALLATTAEHIFPVLILLGLATRLSAAALLGMTLVIQVFVYPGAWAIHATWAAVLLMLMRQGAGGLSLDALMQGRAKPAIP